MKVGITGTRSGITFYQKETLKDILSSLFDKEAQNEFHHGDCVGADNDAARMATGIGYRIICHPPDIDTYRAYTVADEYKSKLPYLVRNRNIVDAVDVLLVVPKEMTEQRRSGTWSTFRYAEKVGCLTHIIYSE